MATKPTKQEGNVERVIAKCESTMLGLEDHGIFTCYVHVTYGGSHQGIGGFGLDEPVKDDEGSFLGRVGTAYGMEFIMRLMRACGVERWEQLPGRTFYVLKDGEGWGAKVLGVEPLPTEGGEAFLFADIEHLAER